MKILTVKESMKAIKLIAVAGKKLDERIHEVGVSGLAHCLEHGDSTALTALCNAMPKSARGNALKEWITEHAPLAWVNAKQAWKGNGKFEGNMDDVLAHAYANPFYNKKDTAPSVFNADKYMQTVVARLIKEGVNIADFTAKLEEKAQAKAAKVVTPAKVVKKAAAKQNAPLSINGGVCWLSNRCVDCINTYALWGTLI